MPVRFFPYGTFSATRCRCTVWFWDRVNYAACGAVPRVTVPICYSPPPLPTPPYWRARAYLRTLRTAATPNVAILVWFPFAMAFCTRMDLVTYAAACRGWCLTAGGVYSHDRVRRCRGCLRVARFTTVHTPKHAPPLPTLPATAVTVDPWTLFCATVKRLRSSTFAGSLPFYIMH